MLPTDNTKRLLLQQHLLNNRFAQLSGTNERQLQTPAMAPTAATAAAAPLSTVLPGSGLSRENGAGFQAPQESNILHFLLAADQERRLKRRLSEMQQLRLSDIHQQIQLQRQQQQQQQQQSLLFQSSLARVERPTNRESNTFHSPTNKTSLFELGSDLASKILPPMTGNAPLKRAETSPVPREAKPVLESERDETPNAEAIQDEAEPRNGDKKQLQPAEQSPEKSVSGGMSRKDARWREMYEELIEYKKNHDGSCIVPRGFSETQGLRVGWLSSGSNTN